MQYLDQNAINRNLFCSICLEVFKKPFKIVCNHSFCYKCIKVWLVKFNKFKKKKQQCPLCRITIDLLYDDKMK